MQNHQTTMTTRCRATTRHLCIQLLVALICFTTYVHARSAYDEISNNPALTKFKEWVEKDEILVLLMKRRSITVFAPTNQAIAAYVEKNPNPDALSRALANYHASPASIKRDQFPFSTNSNEGKFAPLFLTIRNFGPSTSPTQAARHSEHDKYYYVNNAFIIESREDLQTSERDSQVVHIVDEVLAAYNPTSSSVPPNALELISNPSLYELGNLDLSNFLQHIRSNRLESVFSQPGQNTFFVPSKAPLPGAPEFDQYVVKAHVVRNKALFVRTLGDKKKYETLAFDGTVDVELSLVNLTSRFAQDKVFYIQTNTVKNDAAHKVGKVLSRLTLANIPVKNGVIHIIDKPLMLMDMSIRDFLRNQSKLSRFYKMLERHADIISELGRNPHKTILAPDDNAFENLMNNNQNFSDIDESSEEIKKLLRQHIVFSSVSSTELKKHGSYSVFNSSGGVPVGFRLIGTEPNTRLTVESGGVNATSTQSDFGASDGILHIVDRVLGMPFKTMREKLRTQTELKETFKIGTQGGTANWNSKLADENKRYTFFAPSDQAWVQFSKENPSEFKQLDTELYPPISRSILDRHLSAKGQFNKKDLLQTVKKVDTIQGELIISPDPTTKEIFVEWEGKKAKIIKSDIYGLNGVIHVIDQVLAKKRDFKVSGAPTTFANCLMITIGLFISYFTAKLF